MLQIFNHVGKKKQTCTKPRTPVFSTHLVAICDANLKVTPKGKEKDYSLEVLP
jgi:hypothetical protein